MFSDEQKRKIGSYISDIIIRHDSHGKYGAKKRFSNELSRQLGYGDNSDVLESEYKRIIKMLEGNSAIQIRDLQIISEMYDVPIEEILSAGEKKYIMPELYIRNYDLAASSDRALWDKYINKENMFVTCSDEYEKTLIEYAVEFENYDLITYLLDNKIIWFVDDTLSASKLCINFGGGINKEFSSGKDSDIGHVLKYNDHLRTRTIALAIKAKDFSEFDLLNARSFPELYMINENGAMCDESAQKRFADEKCDAIIDAILLSDSAEVFKYFSEEFSIISYHGSENKYVFPYTGELLCGLIDANRFDVAEIFLKTAIEHNKYVYSMMNEVINEEVKKSIVWDKERKEALVEEARRKGVADEVNIKYKSEREIREVVCRSYRYDRVSHTVSYFSDVRHHYVSNLVLVENKKGSKTIKKLVDELNTWYRKTIELGGEKYAEVLHEL